MYSSKQLSLSFIGLRGSVLPFPEIGDPFIPILAQLPWAFGLEWHYPRVSFCVISCIPELQPSRLSMLRFQLCNPAYRPIISRCFCYDPVYDDSQLTPQVPPSAVELLLYVSIVSPP